MTAPPKATRDAPWLFRTYAGHSTAAKSNALYRLNLSKGQTGLSIAFDLPTQTGYDSDHILARGEVGKVGVPVSHLGDMRTLLDGIPLAEMNTSMTINATAAWLLALYVAVADDTNQPRTKLTGTTQNDIIKEYLSRGTYIFPPGPSLKLIKDTVLFSGQELPRFNPTNVCSYHLQEAGATPVEELAFALATAIAVLDTVKATGEVKPDAFGALVGRISFFVNAGLRFVTEVCKMRAFTELWDEITRERYGVTDPKHRLFRYGVQVNSLGLTENQPENNVTRILLEMLAVTLSKRARARAVQLPAWNEALGLPRPFDQQWSLRMQQVLAYETDLLEYDDIFDGSKVIAAKVEALKSEAKAELAKIDAMGGAVQAIDYMKGGLSRATRHASSASRRASRSSSASTSSSKRRRHHLRRARPPSKSSILLWRPNRLRGSRLGATSGTPRPPKRRLPILSVPPGPMRMSCQPASPVRKPGSRRASGAQHCAASMASIARRRASARVRLSRPARRSKLCAATSSASRVASGAG
ncbi:MAG: hypothetical protein RL291_1030 [Pseudomonadota bacterium]